MVRLNVISNAQGEVRECQVELKPSLYRIQDFKVDSAFEQRLSARCKQLDLRKMPGFAIDAQGLVIRQVSVEYSPWLKGSLQP
ncbi:hypothetical protein [Pseudomonas zeae]|uniref:hypothetical protein n=1 Tax=Pseudomonas zeae TaxID=2745510 RepID=UPI0039DF58D9